MSKSNIYICQNCQYESLKWLGQCPKCGKWNTFEETLPATRSVLTQNASYAKPIPLSSVGNKVLTRIPSRVAEFDRALGGGFVLGQVILLAGEPGIGKSTLLTQIVKASDKDKILYICGEESPEQIKIRAGRMKYSADNLLLFAETDTDIINMVIREQKPNLIIVDSVQTLTSRDFSGFAGSVGQVKGAAQKLSNVAKSLNVPLILVGHVTKEGTVAGPKVLEHLVDTVLYLEGDSQHMFRILKAAKNRFGAVSEVGIFEMTEGGMREVLNPSEIFLENRLSNTPGSCVTVVMEGFRPILFEIQALAVKTVFGYPRRTTSGFNANRLEVLLAVLERRSNLSFSGLDVYVNVAGGFKVSEYACDLAVCMAVASASKNVPIGEKTVVFGECGLLGEVRHVAYEEKRIKEARKLGYNVIINPSNAGSVRLAMDKIFKKAKNIG